MTRFLLVGLVVVAACGPRQEVPRLTIPQFEQARQSVSGGIGKRYEDHSACKQTAVDAGSMVACMERSGYGYLPRSAEPQATECWRLRDVNQAEPLPEALCFVRGTPAAR